MYIGSEDSAIDEKGLKFSLGSHYSLLNSAKHSINPNLNKSHFTVLWVYLAIQWRYSWIFE